MARGSPDVLEYGQGDTWQVGGSRFALFNNYAFNPVGYGPLQEQVPYALPSVPPVYGQGTALGGDMGQTQQAAVLASSNPLSGKFSPLPWVLGGIFVSVLALHWLHWHDRGHKPEEEAA
jgi:hypothetical protein